MNFVIITCRVQKLLAILPIVDFNHIELRRFLDDAGALNLIWAVELLQGRRRILLAYSRGLVESLDAKFLLRLGRLLEQIIGDFLSSGLDHDALQLPLLLQVLLQFFL